MDLTIEQLLRGKSTKIKDKEFLPTEGYVTPFFERMNKIPGTTFRCHAELPKQITITTTEELNSIEDITYNRVWIEAILPESYIEDNHSRVAGMVYGIDTRVPIVKFYTGGENRACTNLMVFDPTDLQVQTLEPKKAINFGSLDYILNKTSTMSAFLHTLHSIEFDCSIDNIHKSLGYWLDNSIELCYNTGMSKASIAASTVISAYKSLFKSTKSPYYVDIEKKPSVDMFTVYNAFTDILTHKDKDICNKADKCLLIKDILGITE